MKQEAVGHRDKVTGTSQDFELGDESQEGLRYLKLLENSQVVELDSCRSVMQNCLSQPAYMIEVKISE